jgi:hypothetical protein
VGFEGMRPGYGGPNRRKLGVWSRMSNQWGHNGVSIWNHVDGCGDGEGTCDVGFWSHEPPWMWVSTNSLRLTDVYLAINV